MEQAIQAMRMFFEVALNRTILEWQSQEYKRIIDCPSCKEAVAYRRAINALIDTHYTKEDAKLHRIQSINVLVRAAWYTNYERSIVE